MPALARPNPFPSTMNRRIFAPCRVCLHAGINCISVHFLQDSQGFAREPCPVRSRAGGMWVMDLNHGPVAGVPAAPAKRSFSVSYMSQVHL